MAEINPPVSIDALSPDSSVSFIPMADVSDMGQWTNRQTRTLREVKNGYTAFKEGDVLFAKITPCMENGKGCHAVGLENGVGFGSTEFHVLRPKSGADARFVFHWSQSEILRRKAEAKMIGSAGQQRVPADFFETFEILLFESDEQRRIAEVLDAVDAVLQRTDALINKLKWMKAGLLNDLLTCGIDRDGKLRDPVRHPEQFKNKPPFELIPKDWRITALGKIGAWLSGGTPNKSVSSYWDGDTPWVSPKDMKQFYIDDSADRITELGIKNGTRKVPPDTILIVVRGMVLAHTLPVCVTTREVTFNQDIKAIACNAEVLPLYLAFWLAANSAKLLNLVTESTHGTKRFDMRDLLGAKIGLPEDEEEQKRIVEVASNHDALIRVEEANRNKLIQIKKGLMHDLLTGRVLVPAAKSEMMAV